MSEHSIIVIDNNLTVIRNLFIKNIHISVRGKYIYFYSINTGLLFSLKIEI